VKRQQLDFFATGSDLEPLLRAIQTSHDILFIKAGLFASPIQDCRKTLLDSYLGIATKGDSNHEDAYLVSETGTSVTNRPVPQHSGGIKYAIDQKINPKSLVFRPGGIFGENIVIAGYVGTVSEDTSSMALFKLFSKEINRQFTKVKSFHVGKKAYEYLEQGWRLTSSEKAPSLYDLQK
jgi:hypothetical protein